MNSSKQIIIKSTQILLVVVLIFITVSIINENYQNPQNDVSLFRKHSLENTTSYWVIDGRYSKDQSECIENCIRQGGINCGGVLYYACCASQENCYTYPLGICKCNKLLPNFRCFKPS